MDILYYKRCEMEEENFGERKMTKRVKMSEGTVEGG